MLPEAIDIVEQSVGMKVESELQPDINVLYSAYLYSDTSLEAFVWRVDSCVVL